MQPVELEHAGQFLFGERPVEEIALHGVTALVAQEFLCDLKIVASE